MKDQDFYRRVDRFAQLLEALPLLALFGTFMVLAGLIAVIRDWRAGTLGKQLEAPGRCPRCGQKAPVVHRARDGSTSMFGDWLCGGCGDVVSERWVPFRRLTR